MAEKITFRIDKEFTSLSFLKNIKGFNIYLVEEFDIDPFTKWSIEFSSEYWYVKYHLLENGKVKLNAEDDDFEFLYKEQNLNINWVSITDFENFTLKCVDGDWRIEILKLSEHKSELLEYFGVENS